MLSLLIYYYVTEKEDRAQLNMYILSQLRFQQV